MGQNTEYNHDRRDYDILLEKVIRVTEDNLKTQHDYLQKLAEIKARFDLNDRDHADVKQALTHVTTNTFDILNKMNKASNEDIIEMLEKNADNNTAFSYKFDNANIKLEALLEKLKCIPIMENEIKEVKKSTLDSAKSFSLIQKLLGAILIAVAGIQIASGVWKVQKDEAVSENVKQIIQQEIRKAIK